jgi:hypothetical protein
VSGRGTDFFISHAGRDTGWAEWLAWQLQQAGYSVELDVWDWAPGEDFVARMETALESADRLLAVCTEAYFASTFGGAELRAAFARQPTAVGRIVPVLVEACAQALSGKWRALRSDAHRCGTKPSCFSLGSCLQEGGGHPGAAGRLVALVGDVGGRTSRCGAVVSLPPRRPIEVARHF